jgi:hypothetical protein
MSEVTANPDPRRPEETKDGLDEVEEALRRAAENPVSGREKL